MPSLEKHIELSLQRTGKEFREVHEWMDGKNISRKERVERHIITNIPKFIPVVKKQFGKDGLREYLQHLEDDYNQNLLPDFLKFLKGSISGKKI